MSLLEISIHAPRAGCDASLPSMHVRLSVFQSTHPVRGATFPAQREAADAVISIHAPRVGCDAHVRRRRSCKTHFNPRTPCGARHSGVQAKAETYEFQSTHPVRGATDLSHTTHFINNISIHAPRVGRDSLEAPIHEQTLISIHAPRVGRDQSCVPAAPFLRNFNPRATCGARHLRVSVFHVVQNFNPRATCGARRTRRLMPSLNGTISIHAPRVGRDE